MSARLLSAITGPGRPPKISITWAMGNGIAPDSSEPIPFPILSQGLSSIIFSKYVLQPSEVSSGIPFGIGKTILFNAQTWLSDLNPEIYGRVFVRISKTGQILCFDMLKIQPNGQVVVQNILFSAQALVPIWCFSTSTIEVWMQSTATSFLTVSLNNFDNRSCEVWSAS